MNKDKIDEHFMSASAGLLRRGVYLSEESHIIHKVLPEGVELTPHAPFGRPSFVAIHWIVSASQSWRKKGINFDAVQLQAGIDTVVNQNWDLSDFETLKYLNEITKDPAPYRWPAKTATRTVPSVPVARFLQQHVAAKMADIGDIARTRHNNLIWYDVAVFAYVSYLITHGFPEGNGRTSRALYAAILIRNNSRLRFPQGYFLFGLMPGDRGSLWQ